MTLMVVLCPDHASYGWWNAALPLKTSLIPLAVDCFYPWCPDGQSDGWSGWSATGKKVYPAVSQKP